MKMAVRAEVWGTGCIVGGSRQPPCQQNPPFLSTVWQWGYISSPQNPSNQQTQQWDKTRIACFKGSRTSSTSGTVAWPDCERHSDPGSAKTHRESK